MYALVIEYEKECTWVPFDHFTEAVFYAGAYLCDPAVRFASILENETLDVIAEYRQVFT